MYCIGSNDEKSQDQTNLVTIGLMVLLAVAMTVIAIVAMSALFSHRRSTVTGHAASLTKQLVIAVAVAL